MNYKIKRGKAKWETTAKMGNYVTMTHQVVVAAV
jgi:hypothetical protein